MLSGDSWSLMAPIKQTSTATMLTVSWNCCGLVLYMAVTCVCNMAAHAPMQTVRHDCTHICTHACTHICTHAYTHACTHVCKHVCTHAYTHACTHVYTRVYICIQISVHIFRNAPAHMSVYMPIQWGMYSWAGHSERRSTVTWRPISVSHMAAHLGLTVPWRHISD